MSGPDHSNPLGLDPCTSLPVRAERPTTLEYVAAELWVRERYRRYFADLGGPQVVTWQLERFFMAYETGHRALEVALEVLETDFRNVFSNSLVRRFRSMMAKGATDQELLELLKAASPGGALKPDMLGLRAAGTSMELDAVEVGTVKTATSTYDELTMKMDALRSAVVPQLRLRMQGEQMRAAGRGRGFPIPQDYPVRGSAFRLEPWARIMPLPVRISGSGRVSTVDWICFHPSDSWRPAAEPPTPVGERKGTDGLIIYHIHRARLPDLPEAVRRHVRRELESWKRQRGLSLELNPALGMAMRESASAWSHEALVFFAALGAAALVILFVAIAVEVGVVALGAAAIDAGLVALSGAPAALMGAVQGAGEVAALLWPGALGAASLMPARR